MAQQKPNIKKPPQQAAGSTWFDRLSPIKKDVTCLVVLLLIIYVLFFKIIFQGMLFADSGDTVAHESWGNAIQHLETTEHIEPLWIPYIFGGMPVFGALLFPRAVNYLETAIQWLCKIFFFSSNPWMVPHFFLAGVFMYLLARQLRLSQLPSLFAAVTLMLTPYVVSLAQQGHGSKIVVLSYIPLLFLLTYRLFEKRSILNFSLLAAVLGMTLLDRHPQMAFYGLLLIGCYLLYEIIFDVREKKPLLAGKKVALVVIALALGFAIYSYEFLPTQEYSKYSIRGGAGEGSGQTGLTYDYATGWSFHPLESLTYILPSFFGFSSGYVTDWQGQEVALPLYWGWMPFTEAPVYIGILPIVLAIMALVFRRNRLTWFLLLFSGLVLLMSFGNYFGLVYNLLFDYLPFFNKFRAPSMVLYLMPITIGLLAAFGISFLAEISSKTKEFNTVRFRKRLLTLMGVLAGILLVGMLARSSVYSFLSGFMFSGRGDMQQVGQQGIELLKEKRFDVFWSDFVKNTILIIAFLGLAILWIDRKIAQTTMGFGVVALLVIDLVMIDVKYINPRPANAIEEHFQPDATVQFFKSDTSLYRVFPVGQDRSGQNLFQDNTYMYHIVQSIGGYSPAKLKIYQEMIDSCLFHGSDPQFPINMNVINMLNTKYVVAAGQLPGDRFTLANVDREKGILTYKNPGQLPRAWFVDTAIVARSKRAVFNEMNEPAWSPKTTAILEKTPAQHFSRPDSSSVAMEKFGAHTIVLKAFCNKPGLLVLSEVYYPAGWKAFIDGAETDIYKTNYILRSIVVPAGRHTVELRFASPTYDLGFKLTQAGWGITVVLILLGVAQMPQVRQRFFNKGNIVEKKEEVPAPQE